MGGLNSERWRKVLADAKALHEHQRYYDELHHLMRIEWLSEESPKWGDGEPISSYDVRVLLRQSRECLRLSQEYGISSNSVDLRDAEYLRELDSFAANRSILTGEQHA